MNFNRSGQPGTTPATLELLFTFSVLSGQLGFGPGTGSAPAPTRSPTTGSWSGRLVDAGGDFDSARGIDTRLVGPLFELRQVDGRPEPGDGARPAVRHLLRGYLLRGYLLRMPVGRRSRGR